MLWNKNTLVSINKSDFVCIKNVFKSQSTKAVILQPKSNFSKNQKSECLSLRDFFRICDCAKSCNETKSQKTSPALRNLWKSLLERLSWDRRGFSLETWQFFSGRYDKSAVIKSAKSKDETLKWLSFYRGRSTKIS